ncbi:MAG: PAS domain S-box protein [Melioribacteraceae bacterium]|nr:PAS domain S-box protein [Melioribacteraceae bacterium]
MNNQKKLKHDFYKSSDFYKIIVDNTYDWEFFQDKYGKSIYHSPSCKRITGYSSEEFVRNKKKMLEIVHPDDKKKYLTHKKKKSCNGDTIEYRIIDANGKEKWIEQICQHVYNDYGKMIGIRGSNREITERKNIERKKYYKDQQYKNLIEHSPFGIGITKGYEIIYANDPLLRMHGVSTLQEMKSKSLIERVFHKDRRKVTKRLEMIEKGTIEFPFSIEHRIVRNDGEIRLLKLIVSDYYEDNEHYLQAFFSDITDQINLVKEKKQLLSEFLRITKKNELVIRLRLQLEKYFKKYAFNVIDKKEMKKIFDQFDDIENDWRKIKIHFEEIHGDFLIKLKKQYPGLTQSDLRHCAYIKLKFSTKEIANLTNVKDTSIQRSRVRLKKKLGLGITDNLIDFLEYQ